MKLLMLTPLVGANFAVAAHDVVEHPDAIEAKRWIDAEFAEEAPKAAKVTQGIPPPEPAARPIEVEIIDGAQIETAVDVTPVEAAVEPAAVEVR